MLETPWPKRFTAIFSTTLSVELIKVSHSKPPVITLVYLTLQDLVSYNCETVFFLVLNSWL